jgi:hypothetical protein
MQLDTLHVSDRKFINVQLMLTSFFHSNFLILLQILIMWCTNSAALQRTQGWIFSGKFPI